ncbi:MAG: hypothetical protein M0P31_18935 [Solirubrobacteraceae bacterium]|nr:hypothetical protein [Solirubrobacteraceae bacterium]
MRVLAHRGNPLASGVLLLAVFHVDLELRGTAGHGLRLLTATVVATLAIAGLLGSPRPTGRRRGDGPIVPRTYQEVLGAIGVLASLAAALHVTALAGAHDGGRLDPGPTALAVTVAAIGALALARRRGMVLVLGLGAGLTVAAAVAAVVAAWPGDHPLTGARWTLLGALLVLTVAALNRIDRRYPEALILSDVIGLVGFALASSFLVGSVPGLTAELGLPGDPGPAGLGWQLLLLAVGFALLGLGAMLREPVPGTIGGLVVVGALVAADEAGGGSSGWPWVLAAVGVVLVLIALRPVEREIDRDVDPVPPVDPSASADADGRAPGDGLPLPRLHVVPRPDDDG